ncbi:N-acetylmuramoyl-L-alanine amidase [Streptomyces sp. NPDC000410]|uniref:N-acetylmuramoyl-L-alanine amidase n=1 Tax=Streptomyces sp. NPDC000410 TaxID=3154254 RepID=UPI00332D37BF
MRHSRTALALAGAAAIGLCLTEPAGSAPPPITKSGDVHTVPVPAGTDPASRTLPARATEPFSMIGLTWNDPSAQLGGTAEVRTRDSRTGTWSAWHELDADVRTPESGPERAGAAGVRGGTAPLWAGPSDGVELRADGETLPEGLRVELVDPDGGDDVVSVPTTLRADEPAGAPALTSRAGWGADESLVTQSPTYNTSAKAVFVHHTAGTNDYTCAESASIVRGIFTYHVQSQGWSDIGYHFLVDKCGTVFEGRGGGIDRPVQGAHTYGFNIDTSSISVLGDFMTATAPQVVLETVAELAAWKLGLDGYDPEGTVGLTSSTDNGMYDKGEKVTLNRISGHRDGSPTDCPGDHLYDDLPEIRALAAQAAAEGDGDGLDAFEEAPEEAPFEQGVGNAPGDTPGDVPGDATEVGSATGDFNADGRPDTAVTYRSAQGTRHLVLRMAGAPATVLHGAGGQSLAAGDLNGDGYDDLAVAGPEGITTFRGSPTGLTTTGAPTLDVAPAAMRTPLDLKSA